MRLSLTNYKDTVDKFLQLASAKKEVIFFDLETTGFSPDTERIISCSAIKCRYDGENFTETTRLNRFINPGFPISGKITEITGISNETVKTCPTEFEIIDEIKEFFGESPIIAGYNSVSFDERFMEAMYVRTTGQHFHPAINLDVLKMAKEMTSCTKYNLQTVATALGLDKDIKFHTSMDDVIATKRIFDALLPQYAENAPEKKEKKKPRLTVRGVNYWAPNHTLERIYIQTWPYTKSYLDIYRKEWRSDYAGVDMMALRNDTLRFVRVETERDLIRTVKKAAV